EQQRRHVRRVRHRARPRHPPREERPPHVGRPRVRHDGHLVPHLLPEGRPPMTPTEQMREAARLMRERATASTSGPWFADGADVLHLHGEEQWGIAETLDIYSPEREAANAAHIAGWHPGVALAVADMLDRAAHTAKGLPDHCADSLALTVA